MPGAPSYHTLDPEQIAATIDLLRRRVEHRFPASGLAGVARELDRIAEKARERSTWIARPILLLRLAVAALLALIVAGLLITLASLPLPREHVHVVEFVQVLESGINDVVLIGAACFFLLTVETRVKRGRALEAIREMRSIAHVIDMHQLTKDPEWLLGRGRESGLLPPRTMTRFELGRYLDYCSEMLSLVGKVAALYVQRFDDDVALAAVNEVEQLTNGLSRTIWQKLMILHAQESWGAREAPLGPAPGDTSSWTP
ncbi:MAG: hypothetical protein NDJ94_10390 [Vicinamibacteria bacterium]|nr:hypothetical protein [Vicinamibacteria bacterium]